jgi:thymidylate synthase (FAD)
MPNRSEPERPATGLEEAAATWTPAVEQSSAAQLTDAQEEQVRELRAQATPTRRAVVGALEEILYQPLPVLDRGFVRVIDYMGDDGAIVQAARVSYGRGTRKVSDDRGLINYLMRMRHTSPFEMCEIKLHVKLPIFVARQWIRHRTANVNEYSARYSVLEDEFYVPAAEHVACQASSNRQGRAEVLDPAAAAVVQETVRANAARAYAEYLALLNHDKSGEAVDPERAGLGRELARIVLPLNTYTEWYWKTDLHNLLNFLSLRADAHAQYEIRVYAEAMIDTLERWVPMTAEAFRQYRLGGAQLSASGLAVVRKMLAGEPVDQASSGMSKREWTELMQVLGRVAASG